MKQRMLMVVMICCFAASNTRLYAQSHEVQQLLLNIEKLAQLKDILSNMKKGYEVVSKGYGTVKDLTEGNFSLHKTFLDGLMEVSPAVRKYRKVSEIIDYQLKLVREYKRALQQYNAAGVFSPKELAYIARVYDNLLKRSLDNLDELAMVVTSGKLRMSDDERITAIDRIHHDMSDKLNFLRSFNNSNSILGLQRVREQHDVNSMRKIYGIGLEKKD